MTTNVENGFSFKNFYSHFNLNVHFVIMNVIYTHVINYYTFQFNHKPNVLLSGQQ